MWAGFVAVMKKKRNTWRVLVRKQEGKGPLGRPRHRRKDSIKYILNKYDERIWTILAWLKRENSSCGRINGLAELLLASQ
jgi:hypothetical protein